MYLHVGAPKSGTTHVQDRLSRNSRHLARHGVHVPNLLPSLTPARAQFRAALDLLGQDWGGPHGHASGHWARLVEKVSRTDGSVVISHEILAPAPPDVIDKALTDLGREDVHIIYTARDLGHELTSAWQESIRMGRHWHLRRFLKLARRRRNWFARALDLPAVLEAWGRDLAPERLHVVTVPTGGGRSDALWHRFCDVLEVPPTAAPRSAKRTNPSIDAVATELVRRLNVRYAAHPHGDPNRDRYIDALLDLLDDRRSERVPIELPPQDHAWVSDEARRQIAWLQQRGVSVHGDLDDLLPATPANEGWVDPDRLPRDAVLDLALDALQGQATSRADRAAMGDRTIAAMRNRIAR